MSRKVALDILVEDLARDFPESVGFLTRRGFRCIRCGEPVWGTLGELMEEKGVEDPESVVRELNAYLQKKRGS